MIEESSKSKSEFTNPPGFDKRPDGLSSGILPNLPNSHSLQSPGSMLSRRRGGKFFIVFAPVALLMGLTLFAFDASISSTMREPTWGGGDLRKWIALCEFFAHGLTVAMIFLTLIWIDQKNRKALWVAVWITLAAGLGSNVAKTVFPRVRPHSVETLELGQNESGWLPPLSGSIFDSKQRSFPSGHSATAFGLACGLSFVYPRGWWLFFIYAGLAGLQRVVSGAHFPSDVLAGAAFGMLVGGIGVLIATKNIPRPVEGARTE